jgi:hypothetical protein
MSTISPMIIRWAGLLMVNLLGVIPLATARPALLAWDYVPAAPPSHTGFVLRGCQQEGPSCVMRDVQQLGPQRRQTRVRVPQQKVRCFEVIVLDKPARSESSNRICLH